MFPPLHAIPSRPPVPLGILGGRTPGRTRDERNAVSLLPPPPATTTPKGTDGVATFGDDNFEYILRHLKNLEHVQHMTGGLQPLPLVTVDVENEKNDEDDETEAQGWSEA